MIKTCARERLGFDAPNAARANCIQMAIVNPGDPSRYETEFKPSLNSSVATILLLVGVINFHCFGVAIRGKRKFANGKRNKTVSLGGIIS